MPTTTNFGWTTPADTDLVKDGASAIRTLGSAIDTSLVDLKGGTSGQYLSKNSNTDLDYLWVTLPASGATLISTTSFSAAATTTVDNLFSNSYKYYMLHLAYKVSSNGNQLVLKYRYGTTTHSANYSYTGVAGNINGSVVSTFYGSNQSAITFPATGSAQFGYYNAFITRQESSGRLLGTHNNSDITYNNDVESGGFQIASAQAWSGIEISASAGTVTGVLSVYGLA
jgi:hypothetical protein